MSTETREEKCCRAANVRIKTMPEKLPGNPYPGDRSDGATLMLCRKHGPVWARTEIGRRNLCPLCEIGEYSARYRSSAQEHDCPNCGKPTFPAFFRVVHGKEKFPIEIRTNFCPCEYEKGALCEVTIDGFGLVFQLKG